MSLKEKLEDLKVALFTSVSINRDFEFKADLEDHPLGMQNVYRLHYVNYHRIGENYGMDSNNIGVIDWSFRPFTLPSGMCREDAFKVLSYLTDYIEKKFDIESCSRESVATLDEVIDLDRLGFTRLNTRIGRNETNIINLFTVTGRLLLFKQSEYYSKYFNWYNENVALEEVKRIYDKCGIEFYDLVPINIQEGVPQIQNYSKQLQKNIQKFI